jgi:hypothetical protein
MCAICTTDVQYNVNRIYRIYRIILIIPSFVVINDKLKSSVYFILFSQIFQRFLNFLLMVVHCYFFVLHFLTKYLTANEATPYVNGNKSNHNFWNKGYFTNLLSDTDRISQKRNQKLRRRGSYFL